MKYEHYMIFAIEHIVSGKTYVKIAGYDIGPPDNPLLALSRSSMPMGRVVKRLGIEAFRVYDLESVDDSREARRVKKQWIEELNSDDPARGWNLPRGPMRYRRHTTTRPGRAQFLKEIVPRKSR